VVSTALDLRAQGNLADSYAASRDALFYALLWGSGLRALDALRLNTSQLRLYDTGPGGKGAYLDVTLSKSGASANQAQRITIPDATTQPGAMFAVSACWRLMEAALRAVGLETESENRPLFSNTIGLEDGSQTWGPGCDWAPMHARHLDWLRAAGFNEKAKSTVTLHSFHGSRAAREKAAGIPRADTCASMNWSPAMYEHYLGGREPLTMKGVLLGLVKKKA
jgi:hypothetical protein